MSKLEQAVIRWVRKIQFIKTIRRFFAGTAFEEYLAPFLHIPDCLVRAAGRGRIAFWL